jgi:ligand-binding sensor domain-containing protein
LALERIGAQPLHAVDGITETVSAIHVDHAEKVWIGTVGFGSGGLTRIESTGAHLYTAAEGFTGGGVYSIGEDRAGNLWNGCVNGLYPWDGRSLRLYQASAPPKIVTAIAEASDGEIIAGNNIDGLERIADWILRDHSLGRFNSRFQTSFAS